MNNVYLCMGKYANSPFYLEISDNYVYSIEELCYYLIEKIYLLDEDVMTPGLSVWLRQECGLEDLADELDYCLRKKVSVTTFVVTLLTATRLYDEATIKKVEQTLKEQTRLTPFERMKKRAEFYFVSGRFGQARKLYFELLAKLTLEDTVKRAVIYYDIASVYAMEFAYDEAARYYYESYVLSQDADVCQSYLMACRMYMSDKEYAKLQSQREEWKKEFEVVERIWGLAQKDWETSEEKAVFEEWKEQKEQGKYNAYYEKAGKIVNALKCDYRRQIV